MIFDCAGFGGVSVIVFCEDAAPFMEEVTKVLEEVVATIGGGGVALGGGGAVFGRGGVRGRGTSAIAFSEMCHRSV